MRITLKIAGGEPGQAPPRIIDDGVVTTMSVLLEDGRTVGFAYCLPDGLVPEIIVADGYEEVCSYCEETVQLAFASAMAEA